MPHFSGLGFILENPRSPKIGHELAGIDPEKSPSHTMTHDGQKAE
jgi:hypothetical protein